MVRHIVLFRWNAEATEVQRRAVVDGLSALRDTIPEIVDYRFGPDLRLADGNHDFAVAADFNTRDDYLTYRDHPAHQAFIAECIRPIVAERVAIQFEW